MLCTSPNATMYGILHVLVLGARLTYVNAAMTESNSVHHKHETTRVAALQEQKILDVRVAWRRQAPVR